MKSIQYWTLIVIGALSLILAILVPIFGMMNQATQARLAAQQPDIEKGTMSNQVLTNLIREMAQISVRNPKFKDVLKTYGVKVTLNPPETKPAEPNTAVPHSP